LPLPRPNLNPRGAVTLSFQKPDAADTGPWRRALRAHRAGTSASRPARFGPAPDVPVAVRVLPTLPFAAVNRARDSVRTAVLSDDGDGREATR